MKRGRPPKYKTVDEMQNVIDEYFERVTYINPDTGQKLCRPTMSGLANALDMCRKTLCNYSHKDEFLHTIKKARAKVEESLESALYGNGVAGVIFNLKNNFDWRDKQEVEQSGVTVVKIMGEF